MNDAAPIAPAAPAAATPAPATPAAPVAEAPPPVAPAAPAAAPPSPATAASPAPAAPAAPVAEGSLISAAKPPEPAPAAPAAEGVVAQPPKPGEPASAPPSLASEQPKNFTYQPFQLPEGFVVDDARMKGFQEVLTKHSATQESAQALGQEIMSLYATEMTRVQDAQRQVWDTLQKSWRDEVRADPDVGGNRLETALRECASVIEQYGGDAAEQQALRDVLNTTGAGNNRLMVRLFSRVGRALGEGRLVPAPKPVAPALSRAERRYSGSLPKPPPSTT